MILIHPLGQARELAVDPLALEFERFLVALDRLLDGLSGGSFAGQLGIQHLAILPFLGQFVLNYPVTALKNVGSITRFGQIQLSFGQFFLGDFCTEKEILKVLSICIVKDILAVGVFEAKPPSGKAKPHACHRN